MRLIAITIQRSRLAFFVAKMIELNFLNFDVKMATEHFDNLPHRERLVLLMDPPITVTIYVIRPEEAIKTALDQLHKIAMPETLAESMCIELCNN